MAKSYHLSQFKRNHREFKLAYAERAIRKSVRLPEQQHYTLCGNSLEFENGLINRSKKYDIKPVIFAFNTNKEEFAEALSEHRAEQIQLFRQRFYAEMIGNIRPVNNGLATTVDFDTCDWFLGDVVLQSLEICGRSKMAFITVIIKGRLNEKTYPMRRALGMTSASSKNPVAIGRWLERNTPLHFLDYLVYQSFKDTKIGCSTMATIVMGRKSFAFDKI